nr:diguanylate cyclase [Collinsella aerofaciens]
MLLLYIICQEQLISIDPLTRLNNRNRFETYMLSLFSNVDQAEDVYLLMMDADGFKQINDRYGHVEGDHALQVIIRCAQRGLLGVWWLYRALWWR